MVRPLFITFEGTEGAGKTTQVELLRRHLEKIGHNVLVTRQPGGDPVGVQLRRIMLDPGLITVHPRSELLMMMADRAQSVETVIRPHLTSGGTVICDRYTDSSLAYQGGGRGIDMEMIHYLNRLATDNLSPDCTILLDLDPELGVVRQSHKTKMEMEDMVFHSKIRSTYLDLAKKYPKRIIKIDASGAIDEIHNAILSAVHKVVR
jgi:dTMP kinase